MKDRNKGQERSSMGDMDSGGKKPSNVRKDGLPADAVAMLKEWMMAKEHVGHPYPTEEEKRQLAQSTGLEIKQVNTWFANARKRLWKPQLNNGTPSSSRQEKQGGGGGDHPSQGKGSKYDKDIPERRSPVPSSIGMRGMMMPIPPLMGVSSGFPQHPTMHHHNPFAHQGGPQGYSLPPQRMMSSFPPGPASSMVPLPSLHHDRMHHMGGHQGHMPSHQSLVGHQHQMGPHQFRTDWAPPMLSPLQSQGSLRHPPPSMSQMVMPQQSSSSQHQHHQHHIQPQPGPPSSSTSLSSRHHQPQQTPSHGPSSSQQPSNQKGKTGTPQTKPKGVKKGKKENKEMAEETPTKKKPIKKKPTAGKAMEKEGSSPPATEPQPALKRGGGALGAEKGKKEIIGFPATPRTSKDYEEEENGAETGARKVSSLSGTPSSSKKSEAGNRGHHPPQLQPIMSSSSLSHQHHAPPPLNIPMYGSQMPPNYMSPASFQQPQDRYGHQMHNDMQQNRLPSPYMKGPGGISLTNDIQTEPHMQRDQPQELRSLPGSIKGPMNLSLGLPALRLPSNNLGNSRSGTDQQQGFAHQSPFQGSLPHHYTYPSPHSHISSSSQASGNQSVGHIQTLAPAGKVHPSSASSAPAAAREQAQSSHHFSIERAKTTPSVVSNGPASPLSPAPASPLQSSLESKEVLELQKGGSSSSESSDNTGNEEPKSGKSGEDKGGERADRGHSTSNGSKKRGKIVLPTSTVEYLKNWIMDPKHIKHPYPTEAQKREIMNATGIEMKQLTNWFTNNRKRFWKPRIEAAATTPQPLKTPSKGKEKKDGDGTLLKKLSKASKGEGGGEKKKITAKVKKEKLSTPKSQLTGFGANDSDEEEEIRQGTALAKALRASGGGSGVMQRLSSDSERDEHEEKEAIKLKTKSPLANGKRKTAGSTAVKSKKAIKLSKVSPKHKVKGGGGPFTKKGPLSSPTSGFSSDSSSSCPSTPISFAAFLPTPTAMSKLTEREMTEVDMGPIDHPGEKVKIEDDPTERLQHRRETVTLQVFRSEKPESFSGFDVLEQGSHEAERLKTSGKEPLHNAAPEEIQYSIRKELLHNASTWNRMQILHQREAALRPLKDKILREFLERKKQEDEKKRDEPLIRAEEVLGQGRKKLISDSHPETDLWVASIIASLADSQPIPSKGTTEKASHPSPSLSQAVRLFRFKTLDPEIAQGEAAVRDRLMEGARRRKQQRHIIAQQKIKGKKGKRGAKGPSVPISAFDEVDSFSSEESDWYDDPLYDDEYSKKMNQREKAAKTAAKDGQKDGIKPSAEKEEKEREEGEGNSVLVERRDDVWVQCDKCLKWRRLPDFVDAEALPTRWYCAMNKWDQNRNACEKSEEEYKVTLAEGVYSDIRARRAMKALARRLRLAVKVTKNLKRADHSEVKPDEVNWIQCCNPLCGKWRALLKDMDIEKLPRVWYCVMNSWDENHASCGAPQEQGWKKPRALTKSLKRPRSPPPTPKVGNTAPVGEKKEEGPASKKAKVAIKKKKAKGGGGAAKGSTMGALTAAAEAARAGGSGGGGSKKKKKSFKKKKKPSLFPSTATAGGGTSSSASKVQGASGGHGEGSTSKKGATKSKAGKGVLKSKKTVSKKSTKVIVKKSKPKTLSSASAGKK